jgi:inhibitor of cysteine peptidase
MPRFPTLLVLAAVFAGCQDYTPSPSANISNVVEPHEPGRVSPALSGTGNQPVVREVTLTEAYNGKTLHLTSASSVTINLEGNATTGYSWTLAGINGAAVEPVGDVIYTPSGSSAGSVGGGGMFSAKFRVAKTGQSQITMQYVRPWEKDAPARTFTVIVAVDKVP